MAFTPDDESDEIDIVPIATMLDDGTQLASHKLCNEETTRNGTQRHVQLHLENVRPRWKCNGESAERLVVRFNRSLP